MPERNRESRAVRITDSTHLPCTVEEAFDFVADMRRDPSWAPLVESVEQIAGDGVGARWCVMQRVGQRVVPLEFEMTAYQRPALLSWTAEGKRSTYRCSMVFAPHKFGVRIQQRSEQSWSAPWFVRALGPFLVRRQLARPFRLLRPAIKAARP